MASTPVKRNGKWYISVCIDGQRKAARRQTKAECVLWAADIEKKLRGGKNVNVIHKTFADLLRNYGKLVSPKKRSAAREQKRIEAICREKIGDVWLEDLSPTHFTQWRDKRLNEVSSATVLRDWNLISNAINVAINEWEWLTENPLKKIKRPIAPQHRQRRISQYEINQLLHATGYRHNDKTVTATQRVGAALLFAIETAMRAGEIVGLTWKHVNLDKRVAHLPMTKNGMSRDVPLSSEAIRIMKQVQSESDRVFNLSSSQLDALFRKAKQRTLIEDLHFHDSRAEAITRLAEKFDILTLARISGHRDIKKLMVYYRMSVEDIAKKLD
jgi:integrase